MTNKELQEILKQYPDDLTITLDTPYDWYGIKKVYLETDNDSEPEIIIETK